MPSPRLQFFPMMKGLILFLACVVGCRGGEALLSGPEIYERMLATYESARSYEDEGEVRTVFVKTLRPDRTVVQPFTTAFVRPDAYRYEFKNRAGLADAWDRYLIWRSGDSVKSWWSLQPGIRSDRPLELAIASATGISGGSAANIPGLLLPEMQWGRRLRTLTGITFIRQTELAGAPVYELQGRGPDDLPLTLWIDSRSFLLRQLFAQRQLDGFRTETTTVYSPRVNGVVAPEKLQFNPGEYHSLPMRVREEGMILLPFGLLGLLLLVNLLHWRLRSGSRWTYPPGLRAAAVFGSLAVGGAIGLALRGTGDGVVVIVVGYAFLSCAYTLWRRERDHASRSLQSGSSRS